VRGQHPPARGGRRGRSLQEAERREEALRLVGRAVRVAG
jgi:hypothetical protein